MASLLPFLMFTGRAEEAMRYYVGLFPRSEILHVDRYEAGQPGAEGTVRQARFVVAGQELMCIDSPPVHAFGFTPSISLFVSVDAAEDVDRLGTRLAADGGGVLMPASRYPFAERYTWVTDRFGVSWQLSFRTAEGAK